MLLFEGYSDLFLLLCGEDTVNGCIVLIQPLHRRIQWLWRIFKFSNAFIRHIDDGAVRFGLAGKCVCINFSAGERIK